MKAVCNCGQLTATVTAAPQGTSLCHCHACRTRTGSAFSWNVRFLADDVTTQGESRSYSRTGDEGSSITYHFCPTCGVTVWYLNDQLDGVMIPAGAFAPGDLPTPSLTVYDARRPDWLTLAPMTVWD